MAYSAEISRSNPTCFVLLLDQSGSMADAFKGDGYGRKCDFVADVVNRTLHDLIIRCTKTEAIMDYYYLSVIGYGTGVQSALTGALANKDLLAISELANHPARIEERSKKVPDGAGGLVDQTVRFPIWVDPVSSGGTPMCEAFARARQLLGEWVAKHKNGFPPTVLHLTDGESTDGDPLGIGREIAGLGTADGAALMYTCHVSSNQHAKVEYPADEASLPDDFAHKLFELSSPLPEPFRRAANQVGIAAEEGARGFVFNGDPVSVVQFFDIGTRPANLR